MEPDGSQFSQYIEKIVKFVRLSNIETYKLLIWKVLTIKWSA